MQNYLGVGEDSLRMEVIHEEDESNAAKMSFQQLDALRFELTANPEHDCKLLRKALNRLQQSVQQRAINKQLARAQFEQLKEKLDNFFAQKIEIKSEVQLDTLSFVCHDINILLQLINENYGEYSDVFAESRYDLSSSQNEVIRKKRNSEQLSQIRKKSFLKISQSNIHADSEIQAQVQPNSHRRNNSNSSQSMNSQQYNNILNPIGNVNQINAKYTTSRFQSCENISFNNLNGGGGGNTPMSNLVEQVNIKIMPFDKYEQGKFYNDEDDLNGMAQSSTFISPEDVIINKPKSIDIKQNSFNLFKGTQQQPTPLYQISDNNQNLPNSNNYPPTPLSSTSFTGVKQMTNPNGVLNESETTLRPQEKQELVAVAKSPENLNYQKQNQVQANNLDGQMKFLDPLTAQNEEKASFQSKKSTSQRTNKNNCNQISIHDQDLQQKSTNGQEEDEEDGYYHENMKSYQSSNTQKDQKDATKQAEKNNTNEILQGLEEDFQRIKKLFDDKYLDDVELEREKLIRKVEGYKNQTAQQSNEFKNMISNFEQKIQKDLKYFKDIFDQLTLTTKYIEEKEGWQQEKNKGGMSIQYKKIPNSKLLALRLECDNMEMSIKVLISIVYEIELYSLWFPFCKVGKTLKTVDKACKVVYLKMDVPFISDREVYVHGIGVNRLYKDGSIVIMARSIDKDTECQKETGVEVPQKSKCVRVDIPFFTFVFKPLSENRLQLHAVCNMDAHLKLVPDSMINLVLRKFAYFLFDKMIEQNKKFKGSKWEQNMNANPEFYGWIEGEYKKFFALNPHLLLQQSQITESTQKGKTSKKK